MNFINREREYDHDVSEAFVGVRNQFNTIGFTVESEMKFGWRKPVEMTLNEEIDAVHKYRDERELANKKRLKKEGIKVPLGPDYGKKPEKYEDGDVRGAGNLIVDDIKKQKVTTSMIESCLNDCGKEKNNLKVLTAQYKIARDNILTHVFGYGNPKVAYTCMLDKKALKNNVYRFDKQKVREFTEKFSDKNLEKKAKEVYKNEPATDELKEAFFMAHEFKKGRQVSENYSINDVMYAWDDKKPISADAKANLIRTVVNMKEHMEIRPWYFHILHPIESIREKRMIEQGVNALTMYHNVNARDLMTEKEKLNNPIQEEVAPVENGEQVKVQKEVVKEAVFKDAFDEGINIEKEQKEEPAQEILEDVNETIR